MKIATWNINSVRVRAEQLLNWLKEDGIDIVLLQETKCLDEMFPREPLEDAGYNIETFGQKTYNGVAILSKFIIEDVIRGSEIFESDQQARYIQAFINGYTFSSVYVPNGVFPLSKQYFYKLNFLKNLKNHIKSHEKFVIGGDFNIALTDQDVYNPKLWKGKICCTTEERLSLQSIITECDLIDCLRESYPEKTDLYTWWDYRTVGFAKNHGLRLDYFFTTKDIEFSNSIVKKNIRAMPKPSDHAPLVIEIE